MPHVQDVRATPPDHDRHDVMLVAAFAAGDLSGTDRDHAFDLTRSCASCAELHDDLVAIARATSTVPPPLMARPRDFQLSPADAARLRPGGWRRIAAALGSARGTATRPLGVGLATLGLVGLLVGNVPVFSLGSNAAAAPSPIAASAGRASSQTDSLARPAASTTLEAAGVVPVASAAASSGAAYQAAGGPSASAVATSVGDAAASSGGSRDQIRAATDPSGSTKGATTPAPALRQTVDPTVSSESPLRPLNLAFALAILVGLGLLGLSRSRSRRSR